MLTDSKGHQKQQQNLTGYAKTPASLTEYVEWRVLSEIWECAFYISIKPMRMHSNVHISNPDRPTREGSHASLGYFQYLSLKSHFL